MFGLATIAGGERSGGGGEAGLGAGAAGGEAGLGAGAAEAGTYIRGDPLLRRTVFLLRSDELDEEELDEEDPDELDEGVMALAFLDFALAFGFGLAFFDLAFALAFALARRVPFVAFFRRSSIFHSDPST